ncbi:hypothetical protein [Phenylobacterium sp.]|uniref:hypothetical protein n=1 Tax=Phenylobacterium sp. TaxID=1871053 RepID=UPI002F400A18
MTNAVKGREDEYNDWYSNRHSEDLLKIDGVLGVRRFKRPDGEFGRYKYIALYDIETDQPAAVMAELAKRGGTDALPISSAMDKNVSAILYEAVAPPIKA